MMEINSTILILGFVINLAGTVVAIMQSRIHMENRITKIETLLEHLTEK